MATKPKYRNYSVMATDGGQLVSGSHSQDTTGAANYVEKINFRRETDGEVRREGWSRLNLDGTLCDELGSAAPVRLLKQFSSEGNMYLVAASGDKVYVLNESSKQWKVIAENLYNIDEFNYSSKQASTAAFYGLKAKKIEVVAIDGYLIINNGLDLPLYYRPDWPCAFPMFSLRERGIIRVGTISEFDGRLFIADVEYFDESIDNNFTYFMGASESPYRPPEEFFDYDTYTFTYRVVHTIEFSAWRLALTSGEARSAPNLFGQNYQATVSEITDGVLKKIKIPYQMGGTKQRRFYDAVGFSDSNANGRYDSTSDASVFVNSNGYRMLNISNSWRIANSSSDTSIYETTDSIPYLGDWTGGGSVLSHWFLASTVFNPYHNNLDFYIDGALSDTDHSSYSYSTVLVGDQIRMTVTDSTGKSGVYDAVVEKIESDYYNYETVLTLRDSYRQSSGVVTNSGAEPDADDVYATGDKVVFVLLKEPDIFNSDSSISREASDAITFPEDGSQILKMLKLSDKLIVHRQTGYLAISRGDNLSPFYYEERYKGERVADLRNTIININEQRQIFVGYNGVFSITPASVEPELFAPLMMGEEFWRFTSSDEAEYVYAEENSITQEIFINSPVMYESVGTSRVLKWGVVAFDMINNTTSIIDQPFTVMANVFASGIIKTRRFLMGCHVVERTLSPLAYSSVLYQDSQIIDSTQSAIQNLGARIVRYGYGSNEAGRGPYREFSRDGADYPCVLKFGKNDFADRFSEKKLRSYALHMSDIFDYGKYVDDDYVEDGYVDTAVTADIALATFSTSQVSETIEFNEKLVDLSSEIMIPVLSQGNYFQDTITLSGVDQPFKILGRTFDVSGVNTKLIGEVVTSAT